MAISPLNMIFDMIEKLNENSEYTSQIYHAMQYSRVAGSIFESFTIMEISGKNKPENLKKYLMIIVNKYVELSSMLNDPKTYEDWVEAIENLKKSQLKKYDTLYRKSMIDHHTTYELIYK